MSTTMSTDPRLLEVARLLSERAAAEKRQLQALTDLASLDRRISQTLNVWDESEPQAIPDGTGHYWVVRATGGTSFEVDHTAAMRPCLEGELAQ
jgi:hypothetical protein